MPDSYLLDRVVLDDRWSSQQSGIGRFSREVVSRLPWQRRLGAGVPWSALDAIHPERLRLARGTIIYSPGYNTGLSVATQLVTLHDLMHLGSEGSVAKRAYYDHVIKPAVRRCGMVLTVSETSAGAIRDWLGDDSVDVRVVGNGKSFQSLPDERLRDAAAARRERVAPLRLLYVGNLKAHKGFPSALRALTHIPGATLAVVTADESEVRRAANDVSPDIDERIFVHSDISDEGLSRLYDECDVLVMPSREEGFGLPALEALAHALPVVYWAGCAGLQETLGGYGFEVEDPADGSLWASAIQNAAVSGVPVDSGLGELLASYDWEAVSSRVAAAIVELEHRA